MTWEAPVAGARYKLQWRRTGDDWSAEINNGTALSYDFSTVTEGFLYEFRVVAYKSSYQTMPAFYGFIPVDSTLRGVRDLVFEQIGSTFVSIKWTDDNYRKIVRWRKEGSRTEEYLEVGPDDHRALITNLQAGANYQFYVDQYADIDDEIVHQVMEAEGGTYLDKSAGCCIEVDNEPFSTTTSTTTVPPTTTTTTTTTDTTTAPV